MIKNRPQGFTLLELSIVLIIIALIISGIVVGKSLVQTAKVRATANRYTELEVAIMTFRLKYNVLPGDMHRSQALGFKFTTITTTGYGYGDGNGLITAGVGQDLQPHGEVLLFWRHLSQAGLIENKTAAIANDGWLNIMLSGDGVSTLLLRSLWEKGSYFLVYALGGVNYLQHVGVTLVSRPAINYYRTYDNMDPMGAYMLDTKVDDGFPTSGRTQAYTFTGGVVPSTLALADSGSGKCIATDGLSYNTIGTDAKLLTCQLRIQLQLQ